MTKNIERYDARELSRQIVEDLNFTSPNYLIIDRANQPRSARQLAELLAARATLYERDGRVVKIISSEVGERVEQLDPNDVIIEAHDVCQPVIERFNGGGNYLEPIGLPSQVAKLYLRLRDRRGLPLLTGICNAPLLSDDGGVICERGYNRPAALWCTGVDIPYLPERPSLDDAKIALSNLRTCFASFPFADAKRCSDQCDALIDLSVSPGGDESAFLVGLLTAICRPSLPLAPGLLVRAPQLSGAGTGKGLLVRAIARIAYNRAPRAFSGSGDELTKTIGSALMGSEPFVFLDNFNADQLRLNLLAQMLTENPVIMRALGGNKMVRLNPIAFIAVTGNGVQVTEDLVRRFLIVNLDAKTENPELRSFDHNFEQMVVAQRLDLLAAALTIWRWGRQNVLQKGLPLGSFERWASWCRDPLMALGCADPVQRIAVSKAQDPQRERIGRFLEMWFACHGTTAVKFSELDPRVVALLTGRNAQARVTELGSMQGMRVNGFVFEIIRPAGRWGTLKYSVGRYDA